MERLQNMNRDTAPAVQFINVTKKSRENSQTAAILQNISGEVPANHILTIIGPSGAGKSTLLSLCNLLLTPDAGELLIHSQEVRKWTVTDLRRRVGLVFQTPTMFPGTVLDNLNLGLKLQGKTLENPEEWIEKVGLSPEILKQNANDLSGGQKQRVALARVLANQPDIWLLDEVTSALDPTAAREVEEWILQLQRKENSTVLWVTHNLEQARRVGHLTWLLVNGRLVEASPTEEFFENPQEDVTRRFLMGELGGLQA